MCNNGVSAAGGSATFVRMGRRATGSGECGCGKEVEVEVQVQAFDVGGWWRWRCCGQCLGKRAVSVRQRDSPIRRGLHASSSVRGERRERAGSVKCRLQVVVVGVI